MTALATTAALEDGSADAVSSDRANRLVERYGPILDNLRPGCSGIERRRRVGILFLRDRATAALRVAGWEAAALLSHIEALASVHALATMPPRELEELHHSMTRLMGVASALDQRGPRARGI